MNLCYIALGSNLQNPLQQVTQAVASIRLLGCVTAQSPWYKSKAIGPGDQPDYINGVIALETLLEPLELLHQLQHIEQQQQRIRNIRWGARTLDLDILLFNNIKLDSAELTLPHPRIQERNFVVFPLFDIVPELILPNGQALTMIKSTLDTQGLEKLSQNE